MLNQLFVLSLPESEVDHNALQEKFMRKTQKAAEDTSKPQSDSKSTFLVPKFMTDLKYGTPAEEGEEPYTLVPPKLGPFQEFKEGELEAYNRAWCVAFSFFRSNQQQSSEGKRLSKEGIIEVKKNSAISRDFYFGWMRPASSTEENENEDRQQSFQLLRQACDDLPRKNICLTLDKIYHTSEDVDAIEMKKQECKRDRLWPSETQVPRVDVRMCNTLSGFLDLVRTQYRLQALELNINVMYLECDVADDVDCFDAEWEEVLEVLLRPDFDNFVFRFGLRRLSDPSEIVIEGLEVPPDMRPFLAFDKWPFQVEHHTTPYRAYSGRRP